MWTSPHPSATATGRMTLAPGSQLGPYQVEHLIGRGGMGEVYRARDTRLDRKVALKVLSPSSTTDSERLARFAREARTGALLNHPNIVSVYDVGSHEGMPFVVSELLHGETLRERLAPAGRASDNPETRAPGVGPRRREQGGAPRALKKDGTPLPVRQAVKYALQIARGVVAAHQQGVVHRDLKPENLFITEEGRVKILDFGLAKYRTEALEALHQDPAVSTQPGVLMGTVGYMSPEQVRGLTVDHRSDIFSFGIILYEMISGAAPFKGESAVETLNAILKDDPPSLRHGDGKISAELDRVIRHCLEKDPGMRFQSARDLVFALELVLRSERRNWRRWSSRTASGLLKRGFWAALLRLARAGMAPHQRRPLLLASCRSSSPLKTGFASNEISVVVSA